MDLHAILNAAGQQIGISLPAYLFIITIIIVIHELGHFIAARACGVTVSAFSLGFGPEIGSFTDRKGTRWRLAWIPLGGYVKFVDDDNASSVPTTAETAAAERANASEEARKGFYHLKPVWQRAIIAAAGPAANFLLAIIVFAAFFMVTGVGQRPVKIDEVEPGMPAAEAGLKAGDTILFIDGWEVPSFERLALIVGTCADRERTLVVQRGDERMTIKVTPRLRSDKDILGDDAKVGRIGIKQLQTTADAVSVRYPGPFEALQRGASQADLLIQASMCAVWDIVTTRQSVSSLAGPTKMVELAGKVASVGIEPLIYLLAVISMAIGFTNLLPIPVLDGGHLVFYAIEAIRGRPLSQRTQEMAFRVGLAVVLMLLVITTVTHLVGVFGRVIAS